MIAIPPVAGMICARHCDVVATSMSWCQDWLDLASAHLLPLKFEAFMMAL